MKSLRILAALSVFAFGAALASADCGTCEKKDQSTAKCCECKCEKCAKGECCQKTCTEAEKAQCKDQKKACCAEQAKTDKQGEPSTPPAQK